VVDNIPITICFAKNVQNQVCAKPFLVLFDSGSSHTWFQQKSLPSGFKPKRTNEMMENQTLAGTFHSRLKVTLNQVTFPDFFPSRTIESIEARVFQSDCRYDIILGRDILQKKDFFRFDNNIMIWDEKEVLMRPYPSTMQDDTKVAQERFEDWMEEDLEEHNQDFKTTHQNDEMKISEKGVSHSQDGYKSK
jgi:hypothetical protein